MFDIAISEGIILSANYNYEPFIGSIGIVDNKIECVTEKVLSKGDAKYFINAKKKIIMPGLVNGHCHGDMTFAKGFGTGMTLKTQMEYFGEVGWFFSDLSEEDRYYSRMQTYCEALLFGTTSLVENMFWSLGNLSQKAFVSTGIRGIPVEDIRFDFMDSDQFLSDDMLKRFIDDSFDSNCIPALGILPEEAFTNDRLRKTADVIRKNNVLYTSHLAETTWRDECVKKHFGKSSVKVLGDYGILNDKYIGSHGIYLDDDDINLIAKNNVKIVNTPICEYKIMDGVAPINKLLKSGVCVGLGTDGAMWNDSNDLFREMKFLLITQNMLYGAEAVSVKDVLNMTTINGAKLIGMENELGTLEQGKLADLILIDASAPHMTPIRIGAKENVTSNVVFCATGNDVSDVIVNGKIVVKDKKLTGCNMNEIQNKVQRLSERVSKKLL